MPDLVLSEFAGVSLPDWIDALIRIVFVVALMTVNALALIYLERKVLARFHQRVGPTRTGPFGMLQSAADAVTISVELCLRNILLGIVIVSISFQAFEPNIPLFLYSGVMMPPTILILVLFRLRQRKARNS